MHTLADLLADTRTHTFSHTYTHINTHKHTHTHTTHTLAAPETLIYLVSDKNELNKNVCLYFQNLFNCFALVISNYAKYLLINLTLCYKL